jgi:tetratricopeptide (TPR) repeat protein
MRLKMKKKQVSFVIILIVMSLLTGCSTAGSYDNRGKKCFARGDYEEAAEYFTKAIAERPNRADYYIDYGMALIALKQYDEAIAEFDLAYQDNNFGVIINKKNKRSLRGRGIAYYCKKEYEEAIKQFELALQLDVCSDLNTDILYYKASALMAMGNCEEAVQVYTDILSEDTGDITALMNRAYCYRILGNYENAVADYDKAIELKPEGYDYYFGKYFTLLENNDKAGAKEVLKQVEAIGDKSEKGRFNQAKLHFFQGDYDTALSEFMNDYLDKYSESYYYIGEIYRSKKDYKTAVYYYESYLDKGEAVTADVYNQLGACQIKLGKYKSAIKYIEEGIKMNHAGYMRVLLKNEIVAYEGLSQYDVALEKLEKYLASYPEDEEAQREEVFLKSREQD